MSKKAGVTYVNVKAAVAYQFARGEITWAELKATSLSLNYYSLNQYIDLDPFSLSDSTAFSLSKIADPDSLTLSDSQQLSLQKQLSETLSLSENVNVVLIINRAFADSTAISDVSVLAVDKNFSDTLTASDLSTIALHLSKVESLQVTDGQSFNVSKPLSESLGLTDVFSRNVTYERSFADAFSLDDIETHVNGAVLNKTNVFGFIDTNTFSLQKNATDSLSFSENFSHDVSRYNHSVLNTSAFNTFTPNS
jgi:hypothetical protein|tara:strand:+ start:6975 stop:7727 length:753 start_codon:yes stop_codon:yes gene_type:complete